MYGFHVTCRIVKPKANFHTVDNKVFVFIFVLMGLWCKNTEPCSSFAGTLTVEQIYQDRDQFAKLVREVAAPDVGRMGIEILSFTIKVGYRCNNA